MGTPEFTVQQHDRDVLAAAVGAITGEKCDVGQTYLTFLATLTPVRSGGVDFHCHADGYADFLTATRRGCGQWTLDYPGGNVVAMYERVRGIANGSKRSLARRLWARLTGCTVGGHV